MSAKLSFSEALKLTSAWWSSDDKDVKYPIEDLDGYTVNQILKDNPNGEYLIELNKYIITTSSQEDIYGESNPASIEVLKWRGLEEYIGVPCVEVQRTYLSFYCTKKQSNTILSKINGKWGWVIYGHDFCLSSENNFPIGLTSIVFPDGMTDTYTNMHKNAPYLHIEECIEMYLYGSWPKAGHESGVEYKELLCDILNCVK